MKAYKVESESKVKIRRGIVATKFIKRGTLILKGGEFSRIFITNTKAKKIDANLIKVCNLEFY